MLSVKQQREDKLYKNWLRGSLGLKYVKEGIENVVDSSVKSLHQDLRQSVIAATGTTSTRCGLCTLDNLLPGHAGGRCKQNTRGLCFCNKPSGRRKCPKGVCSLFYDLIVDSHNKRDPSWNNTDPSLWDSDHWQVAKCFMGPSGIADSKSAKETDAAGLLSIAINAKIVTDQFMCGLNVLKQMRETRNKLFHSSSLTLQDNDTSDYIDQMIQLLLDRKTLIHDVAAQNAVKQLQKLKNTTFFINNKDEKEIRKKALQAVDEHTENALESIKRAETKAIGNIESRCIEKIDERKREMMVFLLRTYKKFYTCTELSPILPGKEVDIDEVYVPLDMITVSGEESQYYYRYYNTGHSPEDISTFINLEDTSLNKKNVFILAKPGMGKTAFCKHLISEWCKVQNNTASQNDSIKCLNGVRFLFFVSLKHLNAETTIEQMIKQQLLNGQFDDVLDFVLNNEAGDCLVILDGLDEWTAPENMTKSPRVTVGLPLKEIESGYATVYTTRPWKFVCIQPRNCEVDMKVEITGISPVCSVHLIKNVFRHLNYVFEREKNASRFVIDLKLKNLTRLQHIPLCLILLTCLWYERQDFDASFAGIYSAIIEWLLLYTERRKGKYETSLKDHPYCMNIPVCFKDKFRCQKYFTSLLFPLAHLAFLLTFHQRSRSVFSSANFKHLGLDEDFIDTLVEIGILTEHANAGKATTGWYRSLSFIHSTFREFFAALYIAVVCPVKQLKETVVTAETHLELSGVYQFLSGMNCNAMASVSREISRVVDMNENNGNYRRGTSTYTGFVAEMYRMILLCLKESVHSDIPIVRMVLRDIYLSDETQSLFHYLNGIDMSQVVSLYSDCSVTDEVRTYLSNICDLELLVCKNSLEILGTVLKKCALAVKCILVSQIDLSKDMDFHQQHFAQLTSLTLYEVTMTRYQICTIYSFSPRLESVELDRCLFIDGTSAENMEQESDYFASVKRLTVVHCKGLPFNQYPQPILQELVLGKVDGCDCADLMKVCRSVKEITLLDIELGDTVLPDLFSSNFIYLQYVCLDRISISSANLCFYLEALLKIQTLSGVHLDRVLIAKPDSPRTAYDKIFHLQILSQAGDIMWYRRYIAKSFADDQLQASISTELQTETITQV